MLQTTVSGKTETPTGLAEQSLQQIRFDSASGMEF